MEQRKNNMFMPLLLNGLVGKKSWFFFSTVILLISTMLIPFILGADAEFFIAFGIVEVFMLVFINCLVDNSFLHSDSKFAYYKSKPVPLKNVISINVIINIVLAGYLLLLIVLAVVLQNLNTDILESFKMVIPWLLAGIFLASLSSVLAGNTLVAGIMTIFNFALPAIIFLIITFMLSILENLVVGFNANILSEYFLEKFYKLDYIYFFKYLEGLERSIDVTYFVILGVILAVITLIISKMIKRRKNENTGNLLVFDGYKYFVSVLACLIVPAFFGVISTGRNIINEITVSFVMAALSYYIIIAVMEKTFRITKLSIRVFLASMAVFIAITGGTIIVANQYKNIVPNVEDVKYAYVGSNSWGINEVEKYIKDNGSLDYEDLIEIQYRYGISLVKEKENIETITQLHKEVITNHSYNSNNYWVNNLMLIYFMEDGSTFIRSYKLDVIDESSTSNEVKDDLATKILNSKELKERKYYYLFDENYYNSNKSSIKINLYEQNLQGDRNLRNVNVDEIRPYLAKDINEMYLNIDNAFMTLLSYNYEVPQKEVKNDGFYLEVTVDIKYNDQERNSRIDMFYLEENFKNTTEYLFK